MTRTLTILLLCILCGCATQPATTSTGGGASQPTVKQSLTVPLPPMPAVPQGGQAQAVIQPQPTNSGIYTIVWQPGADTTAYDIPVYSPDLTVPILEWENYGVAFLDYTNQGNWTFTVTNFDPQMFYTVLRTSLTACPGFQFPAGVVVQP